MQTHLIGIQDSPDHRTVCYKGVKFIWIYSNREIIEVFLKEIYENFVGTLETVRNREVSVPWRFDCTTTVDRKILKSRGGAYGGTYVRREICVSKLIGLALQVEGNLLFFLCFTLYLRAIFQVTSPRGSLYLEGRFNGGFSALPGWRDLISYPDLPRPRENRVRSGYEIRMDQEKIRRDCVSEF